MTFQEWLCEEKQYNFLSVFDKWHIVPSGGAGYVCLAFSAKVFDYVDIEEAMQDFQGVDVAAMNSFKVMKIALDDSKMGEIVMEKSHFPSDAMKKIEQRLYGFYLKEYPDA